MKVGIILRFKQYRTGLLLFCPKCVRCLEVSVAEMSGG